MNQPETIQNLMRAFLGECQAHTRYLISARIATQQQIPVIRQVFEFTAKQELIHAQLFAERLQAQGITRIAADTDFLLDPKDNLCGILSASQASEKHEADEVYPAFAEKAMQEGFTQEGKLFREIAEIERSHAERFGVFAQFMREQHLFREDEQTVWLCMNCGHIHLGTEPPQECPVCGAVQGFAVRRSLAPFTN